MIHVFFTMAGMYSPSDAGAVEITIGTFVALAVKINQYLG